MCPLGHVDDMADLLGGVDLVVLPTRYCEGVPRILIEAAASGLPIVTTDMPGCRDIVRDGVNGYLVPPGDAAALAERIGALAADGKLRARMGKAGRSLAESEFSQDRVLERTLAVYREVTGERVQMG